MGVCENQFIIYETKIKTNNAFLRSLFARTLQEWYIKNRVYVSIGNVIPHRNQVCSTIFANVKSNVQIHN